MAGHLSVFATAALGAGFQELLYWYDIYKKLEFKKYDRLIKSKQYWLIVAAFIIGSGLVVMTWFSDRQEARMSDVLIFGASLPLLFKQLVRARPSRIKLGSSDTGYFDVR